MLAALTQHLSIPVSRSSTNFHPGVWTFLLAHLFLALTSSLFSGPFLRLSFLALQRHLLTKRKIHAVTRKVRQYELQLSPIRPRLLITEEDWFSGFALTMRFTVLLKFGLFGPLVSPRSARFIFVGQCLHMMFASSVISAIFLTLLATNTFQDFPGLFIQNSATKLSIHMVTDLMGSLLKALQRFAMFAPYDR